MVTRFVSVPKYPTNANPHQNEAALAEAWLKTGCRDGKSPQNPDFLSLGLIPGLLGNWVRRKPLPIGKVLSSILLPTGIIIC